MKTNQTKQKEEEKKMWDEKSGRRTKWSIGFRNEHREMMFSMAEDIKYT